MRIFLIGYMGSGKTFWGNKLGESLGLSFWDLDNVIESAENSSISKIFSKHGEDVFRIMESHYLGETIANNQSMILACGGGTPCFNENMSLMLQSGMVIYLRVSLRVLTKRLLNEHAHRPLIADQSKGLIESYIAHALPAREAFYEKAHLLIDADNIDIDTFVKKINAYVQASHSMG